MEARATAGTAQEGNYHFINYLRHGESATAEILQGLTAPKKHLSPKFLYDDRGSHLFERIAATADYYLNAAEREILNDNASEIAAMLGGNSVLIEPGCGNCAKVTALLPKLRPALYVPIDISVQSLQRYAQRLCYRYPWLSCTAIGADIHDLSFLPPLLPAMPRAVFYPGSSIGNFEPPEAIGFLKNLRALIGVEGGLLIGVDHENSAERLNLAYNDREGVTAEFNLNVLRHINRIAEADFDIDTFEHYAFYNSAFHRVEMHLRSKFRQTVTVLGQSIAFEKGECIHTENCYKYSTEAFTALAAEAGFVRAGSWHDSADLFAVHYFIPAR